MISLYKLNARVYPTLITLFPILVLGFYFSIGYQNFYGALTGIGMITLLKFVLGEFGRDRGKKIEKAMWAEWGGIPSTQVLRFSNNRLNDLTKSDYHTRLFKQTNVGHKDMTKLEVRDPIKADKIYTSWCDHLRSKTRDTSKFKLLFQENISYGFRRNLLGLKKPALTLLIFSFFVVLLFEYFNSKEHFIELSIPGAVVLIVLMSTVLFWLVVVRKSWVKSVAFAYAERLVECCKNL